MATKPGTVNVVAPRPSSTPMTMGSMSPMGSALNTKMGVSTGSPGVSFKPNTSGLNFSTPPTAPNLGSLNSAVASGGLTLGSTPSNGLISNVNKIAPVDSGVKTDQTGLTSNQVSTNIDNYNKQNPAYQTGGNPNAAANVVGQTFPEPKKEVGTTGGIPNDAGLYGRLVGLGVQNLGEASKVGAEAGQVREAMKRQTQDVMGNPYYSQSVATGQASNIAQQQGSRLEGLAAEKASLTGQGQAYLSGAGAAASQPYGPTTQAYNPIEGTFTGGGANAVNRAIQAANIGSAQDFQTQVNTIESKAPAASSNFEILNNYASQFASGSPIITQIKQRYGTTIEGNNAVAGFLSQLETIRQAYKELTGTDPNIPETATPEQLKQIKSTLDAAIQNRLTGAKNQLGKLGGQSSGSSTGSSSGGDLTWDNI